MIIKGECKMKDMKIRNLVKDVIQKKYLDFLLK